MTWDPAFVRAPYRLLDRVELRDPHGAPLLSPPSGYASWLVDLFELPRWREWPPVMAPDTSERT